MPAKSRKGSPSKKDASKENQSESDAYQKFIANKCHISIWLDESEYARWENFAKSEQKTKDGSKPVMAKFVKKVVDDFITEKSMTAEKRESQLKDILEQYQKEVLTHIDNISQLAKNRPTDAKYDLETATILVNQIKSQVARGISQEQAIIDCDGFKESESVFDSLDEYQKQFGEIEWSPTLNAYQLTTKTIKEVRGEKND